MLPATIGVTSRAQLTYSYDANANVKSITDLVFGGENRSLTYDELDRLKTASGPWGSGYFNYDSLGNITYKNLGSQSYTLAYDRNKNRLSGVTGSKSYQFEYDIQGNIKNNGHHSLTFDKANLMLNVNGGSVASYDYDPHKRRVKVTEAGQVTYQVYNKAGQFLHKFKVSNSLKSDYVYLGSQQVAKIEGNPGVASPVAPSYLTIPETSSDGVYTVSWPSVTGASYYTLQEKQIGGSWATVHSSSNTSKNRSVLSNGQYQYRVRSCASAGCSQYRESTLVEVTLPTVSLPLTPSGLTAPSSDTDGAYTVSWNGVSGATPYELQEKQNSGSWVTKQNSSATQWSKNRPTNGTYYVRVRGCNSAGCSSYSSQVMTQVNVAGAGGGFVF
ncbi:MAG: hypothetical protein COA74_11145 [Gammaproteobacteria bacterium]|nr:MAG: hypothetical protein COA74_11145 [Gammaproteobacteria bacterium]